MKLAELNGSQLELLRTSIAHGLGQALNTVAAHIFISGTGGRITIDVPHEDEDVEFFQLMTDRVVRAKLKSIEPGAEVGKSMLSDNAGHITVEYIMTGLKRNAAE